MAKAEQTSATPSTELMQAFRRAKKQCQALKSCKDASWHLRPSHVWRPTARGGNAGGFAREWRVNCVEANQNHSNHFKSFQLLASLALFIASSQLKIIFCAETLTSRSLAVKLFGIAQIFKNARDA